MTTAPHPSGTAAGPVTDATAAGKEPDRNGRGRKPWYRRFRYVAPLAVVGVVVAGVVAWGVQDRDTASPRHRTGSTGAEANPYDRAFGSFEPITASGSGRGTIPLPAGARAGIVTATYEGSGFFDVGFPPAYSLLSTWVGVRGPYHGSVPFGLSYEKPQAHSLTVWAWEGRGRWQVTIAPVSSAEELPAAVSGTEDAVFLYSGEHTRWVFSRKPDSDRLWITRVAATPRPRNIPTTWEIPGSSYVVYLGGYLGGVGPSVVTVTTHGGWSATAK